jgi:hypothetical protein
MRAWLILSLMVLLPAGTGCSLFRLASHNVFWASVEEAEGTATRRESEHLARAALRHFKDANSDQSFSAAFAQGFKEGYVACLETGPRDVLPAIPPWRDVRPAYAVRRDYPALADWSDGFLVGASMAQGSHQVPPAACVAGPAPEPAPSPELLPEPRSEPVGSEAAPSQPSSTPKTIPGLGSWTREG